MLITVDFIFRIFPAIPANIEVEDNAKRKLWGIIQAVKALYPDTKKWNKEIIPTLENLFNNYKDDIELHHIAFPDNWVELIKK